MIPSTLVCVDDWSNEEVKFFLKLSQKHIEYWFINKLQGPILTI